MLVKMLKIWAFQILISYIDVSFRIKMHILGSTVLCACACIKLMDVGFVYPVFIGDL